MTALYNGNVGTRPTKRPVRFTAYSGALADALLHHFFLYINGYTYMTALWRRAELETLNALAFRCDQAMQMIMPKCGRCSFIHKYVKFH